MTPGISMEDIEKTGRIFIVGSDKINALKESLLHTPEGITGGRQPSTFTCLAAITWAHVTKARISSPKSLLFSSPDKAALPDKMNIMIPIDSAAPASRAL